MVSDGLLTWWVVTVAVIVVGARANPVAAAHSTAEQTALFPGSFVKLLASAPTRWRAAAAATESDVDQLALPSHWHDVAVTVPDERSVVVDLSLAWPGLSWTCQETRRHKGTCYVSLAAEPAGSVGDLFFNYRREPAWTLSDVVEADVGSDATEDGGSSSQRHGRARPGRPAATGSVASTMVARFTTTLFMEAEKEGDGDTAVGTVQVELRARPPVALATPVVSGSDFDVNYYIFDVVVDPARVPAANTKLAALAHLTLAAAPCRVALLPSLRVREAVRETRRRVVSTWWDRWMFPLVAVFCVWLLLQAAHRLATALEVRKAAAAPPAASEKKAP